MCKVFKIKTSSGLVTQTTDPEIVRCLLDNYDGELSIETKKQQVCDEPQLDETYDKPQLDETGMAVYTDIPESEKIKCTSTGLPEITEDDCIINAQPYTETNKLAYINALRNMLNIHLWTAKEYADNGFKTPVNTKVLFNGLIGLLKAFRVQYTIEK